MEVLTRTFEEELREKMIQAKKECKYNPTRFNQMLAQYGGVETARRLIASAQKTGNLSEGLSTLWSCGRLDLSMEESVCKPEYAALFSETEIMYCKNILRIGMLNNPLVTRAHFYTLLTGVCASCGADSPDSEMSGLFCVTLFRTRNCAPCDACASIPAHFAAETAC